MSIGTKVEQQYFFYMSKQLEAVLKQECYVSNVVDIVFLSSVCHLFKVI